MKTHMIDPMNVVYTNFNLNKSGENRCTVEKAHDVLYRACIKSLNRLKNKLEY